jgi:hypothetical protein
MKTAEEMTACGRRGKPKAGFPPRPQALEIAARFPHSLSRDERWKSGKPRAGFPLSRRSMIRMDRISKPKTRRPEAPSYAPRFRLILRLENAGPPVNAAKVHQSKLRARVTPRGRFARVPQKFRIYLPE